MRKLIPILMLIILSSCVSYTVQDGYDAIRLPDESGNKRRIELLGAYRVKLSESIERMNKLKAHIEELEWHINQLENAKDSFQQCPGLLCNDCSYKERCIFFKKEDEKN